MEQSPDIERFDIGDRKRSLLCAFQHIRTCLSGRRCCLLRACLPLSSASDLLLLIILFMQKQPLIMAWRHGLGASILGVVTIIYTLALLTAINLLPIPIAILIFYLFPIFTGIILAVTGWDAFGRAKIIGALIAFLGLRSLWVCSLGNWTPLALS